MPHTSCHVNILWAWHTILTCTVTLSSSAWAHNCQHTNAYFKSRVPPIPIFTDTSDPDNRMYVLDWYRYRYGYTYMTTLLTRSAPSPLPSYTFQESMCQRSTCQMVSCITVLLSSLDAWSQLDEQCWTARYQPQSSLREDDGFVELCQKFALKYFHGWLKIHEIKNPQKFCAIQ